MSDFAVFCSPTGAATKFCPRSSRFRQRVQPGDRATYWVGEGQLRVRERLLREKIDRLAAAGRGKVAASLRLRRHVRCASLGAILQQRLEVREEERRVPRERAAHGGSELVAAQRRHRVAGAAEEVAGVKAVVAQELVGRPVDLVRALLDGHRDLAAAVASPARLRRWMSGCGTPGPRPRAGRRRSCSGSDR